MCRIIIMFSFVSLCFAFDAQKYNSDLLKSYSKLELSKFDSETIQVLEYGIENALYLVDFPTSKMEKLDEIILDNNTNNFTDLGIKILNENQYYKIKNTNSMLVVKSMYVLKNELKNKYN